MSPLVSFISTVRQLVPSALGLTQASSVIPLVRSSEAESGTFTIALVPLKLKAEPYLPPVLQLALAMVPLLPLPDRSGRLVPEPWSKEYAATSPSGGAVLTVALASFEGALRLPAASSAATLWSKVPAPGRL